MADTQNEAIPCLVCETGTLKGMTSVCPDCGSQYRRGVLVTEGKIRRRRRIAVSPNNGHVDLDNLPWTGMYPGDTRTEAIENMMAYYRAHPAKWQRRDPTELYEVYRAEHVGIYNLWELYVRKRST